MFYYNILQPGNKRELAVVAAAAAEPNMVTGTHQMPRMEMVEICTQQPFFFYLFFFYFFILFANKRRIDKWSVLWFMFADVTLLRVTRVCVCVCSVSAK